MTAPRLERALTLRGKGNDILGVPDRAEHALSQATQARAIADEGRQDALHEALGRSAFRAASRASSRGDRERLRAVRQVLERAERDIEALG